MEEGSKIFFFPAEDGGGYGGDMIPSMPTFRSALMSWMSEEGKGGGIPEFESENKLKSSYKDDEFTFRTI